MSTMKSHAVSVNDMTPFSQTKPFVGLQSVRPAKRARNLSGLRVQSAYQPNTDPVYHEFALQLKRSASAQQLQMKPQESSKQLNHHIAHPGHIEFRRRVWSESGLPAKFATLSHLARPATAGANKKQKPTTTAFEEDLNSLVEGNETQTDLVEIENPQDKEAPKTQHQGTEGEKKKISKPTPLPPQPLVRFNSSGDFKAVVDELYGKKDKTKTTTGANKWLNVRRLARVRPLTSSTSGIRKEPILTLKQREEKAIKLKEAAARGWSVVRRYVEHRKFQKYTSNGSLGWTVLKQHLSNMSDMENARKDLYERYGVIPTLQSDGSLRAANVMRPRKAFLKKLVFKTNKQLSDTRTLPKVPAFRETLLK